MAKDDGSAWRAALVEIAYARPPMVSKEARELARRALTEGDGEAIARATEAAVFRAELANLIKNEGSTRVSDVDRVRIATLLGDG